MALREQRAGRGLNVIGLVPRGEDRRERRPADVRFDVRLAGEVIERVAVERGKDGRHEPAE